jgi:hypothetical protein
MRLPGSLGAPDPVRIRIRSSRTAEQALAVLARAASENRYSDPSIGDPRFLRLGGTVAGPGVSLTATPYLSHGVRVPRDWVLTVSGEIHDRPDESELSGTASAPAPPLLRWMLGAVLVFASLVMIATNPTAAMITVVATFVIAMLVLWTLVVRHNQRVAVRNTDRFTEFLATILSERPREP